LTPLQVFRRYIATLVAIKPTTEAQLSNVPGAAPPAARERGALLPV